MASCWGSLLHPTPVLDAQASAGSVGTWWREGALSSGMWEFPYVSVCLQLWALRDGVQLFSLTYLCSENNQSAPWQSTLSTTLECALAWGGKGIVLCAHRTDSLARGISCPNKKGEVNRSLVVPCSPSICSGSLWASRDRRRQGLFALGIVCSGPAPG